MCPYIGSIQDGDKEREVLRQICNKQQQQDYEEEEKGNATIM